MGAPQDRQCPLRASQLKTGTMSSGRRVLPQLGQKERPLATEMPWGTR